MRKSLGKIKFKQRKRSPRDNKSIVPFRLNLLFFLVFVLFVMLIIQMAHLQIMQGKRFAAEATNNSTKVETQNVQRGMIFDSTGKVLVGNDSSRAITYTKPLDVTSAQMYQVANELGKFLSVETNTLSSAQKAEYYLANPRNNARLVKKISGANTMTGGKLTKTELNYVQQHHLGQNLSAAQQNAAVIFNKMNGALSLSTVYIKTKDVSDKEMALVGAHMAQLPGIQVGTSWSRNYPNGDSIKSIVGTVTTQKQGLPENQVNELLAEGYARNDSVGSSYLESEYENVLKGTRKTIKVETQNNKIKKEVEEYGGQNGSDLQLTINAKFQNDLQGIIQKQVNSLSGASPQCQGGYAVVINPNNGAIIGIAGVHRNPKTGKQSSDALGTINQAFAMGSVIKPAMVMGGLQSGVITPENNIIEDTPIVLQGIARIASWFDQNGKTLTMSLTAQEALEVSSNDYMVKLIMRMGGFKYAPGKKLKMPASIFTQLRNNFAQFGLGVKTGIDIPGETTGMKGQTGEKHIGNALYMGFGQFDTYTTMQLAQYISTIANGGYRVQPHVLDTIRRPTKDGRLGAIQYKFSSRILNVVQASPAQWNVIHEGMWDVVHGNNPYITGKPMAEIKPAVAGKTGQAQTVTDGHDTYTYNAASYAPYKHPQVVVIVVYPGISADVKNFTAEMDTTKDIYNAYWKDVQTNDGLH
ncbi:peptidoglycan D,D-transpeptidase FtsI family protein [Ligilactobacillus sp. LYQ60]|uniref:peptidoglycan D,D-transpeptidase FtsI family protein n=1 Tax=unclassified Ligilactobacillus TaxID=2767920 RepID=UPI003853F2B7